jgi:hypothetical protein
MKPHEILPVPESQGAPESMSGVEYTNEEQAARAVELKPTSSAGHSAINAIAISGAQAQVPQSVPSTASQSPLTTSTSATFMTAEDSDLIEKEWVLRAKAIVAATVGDPYAQNIQLNRVKAEYIKKRYQKDIKYKEE